MPGKLLHNRQAGVGAGGSVGGKKERINKRSRGRKDAIYCMWGVGFFEIPLTIDYLVENPMIWDNEYLTSESYPQYHLYYMPQLVIHGIIMIITHNHSNIHNYKIKMFQKCLLEKKHC